MDAIGSTRSMAGHLRLRVTMRTWALGHEAEWQRRQEGDGYGVLQSGDIIRTVPGCVNGGPRTSQ